MADPKNVIKPVADMAQKAAKASKIKSIKLKIKFGSRHQKNGTADRRG